MDYTRKNKDEHNSRDLQHLTKETFNYDGSMILRLPEKRDFFPDVDGNPVGKYFETKSANDRFFKQKSQEKINLG